MQRFGGNFFSGKYFVETFKWKWETCSMKSIVNCVWFNDLTVLDIKSYDKNHYSRPREARLLAMACAPAGLFGLQFLKWNSVQNIQKKIVPVPASLIPWIVAAHFVPGSENLSTNPLIARARELPRLMKVFEVSAKQSRFGSDCCGFERRKGQES